MRHIRTRINEDGNKVIAEIFPVGFVPTDQNIHISLLNHCMTARDDVAEDWVLKGSEFYPADEEPPVNPEVTPPEEESEESEEESE